MTTDVAAREPDGLMVRVAVLLDRAALLAWEHAQGAGVESQLHDLGLGVYLACGTAAQLLTDECHLDEPEDIDEPSVLKLLTDAESLIGPPITARADVLVSGLAVELCDLIREARTLGC